MEIRAEGVQAVLGGSQILKGVDLLAGQKELVGVIGPNGSGKSTLLKCIYRVLKPTGGAVYLDGKRLEGYSYKQSARQVAVLAQHTREGIRILGADSVYKSWPSFWTDFKGIGGNYE